MTARRLTLDEQADEDIWVAGVDGCKAGWLAVLRCVNRPRRRPRVRVATTAAEIENWSEQPRVIAIDVPIGLPEIAQQGGRSCDRLARRYLGPRASSVFGVPSRSTVAADTYEDACATAQKTSNPPRKISLQSFYILPKIREMDAYLRTRLGTEPMAVIECHPEVAFARANADQPMQHPKRKAPDGPRERVRILRRLGFGKTFLTNQHVPSKQAARDDFLDACICCWTAERYWRGNAISLPEVEEYDNADLPMAIWS